MNWLGLFLAVGGLVVLVKSVGGDVGG